MSKVVVGDADSLIALAYSGDTNHQKAKKVSKWLFSQGYQVIYPNTAILEAVTVLNRALNLPDRARLLCKEYREGTFQIGYVDEVTQNKASEFFEEKSKSKKNTFFDAIVVTFANDLNADYIFSFDKWYQKLGFKLANV